MLRIVAHIILLDDIHNPRTQNVSVRGEAEQAAVEDGVAAYENLLSKLSDVPTPAGPTPRQLGTGLVQITSVRPALPASTLRTREVTALEVESQINSRNSRRI